MLQKIVDVTDLFFFFLNEKTQFQKIDAKVSDLYNGFVPFCFIMLPLGGCEADYCFIHLTVTLEELLF